MQAQVKDNCISDSRSFLALKAVAILHLFFKLRSNGLPRWVYGADVMNVWWADWRESLFVRGDFNPGQSLRPRASQVDSVALLCGYFSTTHCVLRICVSYCRYSVPGCWRLMNLGRKAVLDLCTRPQVAGSCARLQTAELCTRLHAELV